MTVGKNPNEAQIIVAKVNTDITWARQGAGSEVEFLTFPLALPQPAD